MARPKGSNSAKPFKDAIRMQLAEAGEDSRKLRQIADSLIAKAQEGDMQAIKELADRVDGKVPQAVIGDADEDPIMVKAIVRTIVHSDNPDS